MFRGKSAAIAARYFQTAALCALALTAASADALAAPAGAVVLLAPAGSVKKVVNGKFAAQVDNGWVIYQGLQGQPVLNFYDADATGSFKLKTTGNGLNGTGLIFNAGGIVFGPCPVTGAPSRCDNNSTSGIPGVGIGFGQATFGGQGGQAGGWVSDNTMAAHLSNPDQATGSIAGLAIDGTNGAFAVGWDAALSGFNHAIVWTLDSAGQTYKPVSQTDLGTLGGHTSSVQAISKNAKYLAGMADGANNKSHAVWAQTGATSWTDIASTAPTAGSAGNIKSRALAASDNGYIAGSVTVKRLIAGKKHSVDIGFVYNTNAGTTTFFEAPGYNVQPLKVLNDGRVVGNLEQVAPGSIKVMHPFIANGTSVTDFGTMNGAYGCRVNRPNNLGEVAGSCIPDSTTPYGVNGTAFFIDAANGGGYVNVDTAIHANADANTAGLHDYKIGSVTSIDDAHEITVMAVRNNGGTSSVAGFLASKPAYNP
jgi:uncharacterized membrane protein